MMKGEPQKELPKIDVYTCKICNKSIIADLESATIHKNVHKIKWEEYINFWLLVLYHYQKYMKNLNYFSK